MLRFTLLLAAALGCGGAPARPTDTTAATLATTKAQIMAADYGADVAALARLRDAVAPLGAHPEHGYLAHYWAGFASWRIAINGASNGMKGDDLRANLERAVGDFEASIALREDFADSHAASASASGWLMALRRDEKAALRELHDRLVSRLARARELAPDNPRVLWVEGGMYLFRPGATVADHARAEADLHAHGGGLGRAGRELAAPRLGQAGGADVARCSSASRRASTTPRSPRTWEFSEKTVRNNITHIFDKLAVESRAQAIVLARKNGFGQA